MCSRSSTNIGDGFQNNSHSKINNGPHAGDNNRTCFIQADGHGSVIINSCNFHIHEKDMRGVFKKLGRIRDVFIAGKKNKEGHRFGFVRFQGVKNVHDLEKQLDSVIIEAKRKQQNNGGNVGLPQQNHVKQNTNEGGEVSYVDVEICGQDEDQPGESSNEGGEVSYVDVEICGQDKDQPRESSNEGGEVSYVDVEICEQDKDQPGERSNEGGEVSYVDVEICGQDEDQPRERSNEGSEVSYVDVEICGQDEDQPEESSNEGGEVSYVDVKICGQDKDQPGESSNEGGEVSYVDLEIYGQEEEQPGESSEKCVLKVCVRL